MFDIVTRAILTLNHQHIETWAEWQMFCLRHLQILDHQIFFFVFWKKITIFLAATKQLYKWYFPSVCLSVCLSIHPSVCHTFFTMFQSSYHEIFRSYYHGQKWCLCKRSRSKVKVTEVNTQLSRFRTLTPVWIHIWQWNHAHSWKQHRRGALLFFKVIHQISRSHGSKNRRIWPRLGVSGL